MAAADPRWELRLERGSQVPGGGGWGSRLLASWRALGAEDAACFRPGNCGSGLGCTCLGRNSLNSPRSEKLLLAWKEVEQPQKV